MASRLDPAEEDRLAALAEYCVLDTAAEAEYDDLTRLAAHVCGTPIALVSLVDRDRQWFKSRVGLAAAETPREQSFCAHAVAQKATLVVSDATADPRFAANPLVTGNPSIRFYAGSPLTTPSGHALGSVCVIDRRPRALEPAQLTALEALSRQVVRLLELRRLTAQLAAALAEAARLRERPAVCGGCLKVRDPGGRWQPLDEYVRAGGGAAARPDRCPTCLDAAVRATLRRE
jgi:GAF domain-containing protein